MTHTGDTSTASGTPTARPATLHRIAGRSPALVAAALVALALVRATSTPEYVVAYGTDRDRADLCRSIPGLPAWRQARLLARLVADPSIGVRLAAMTAAGRSAPDAAVDDALEAMLRDGAADESLRLRAGEVLLGRSAPRPAVLEFLRERVGEGGFRASFPSLVARYWAVVLAGAGPDELRRIVACSLDERDPARESLRQLVLDHVQRFGVARDGFVAALGTTRAPEARRYVLSALTAIDGLMRGEHADDWQQRALASLAEGQPFVYEAEWAHDIVPNYCVADVAGVTCLGVGEGAGGIMHWLKGVDGTVDIGGARFNLFAPTDGTYELWARVYFQDKCGNSFGITIDGAAYANFPDASNVMRRWHWLRLDRGEAGTVSLTRGLHRCRLEAWEDGVSIDKFVLLAQGASPEKLPECPAILWDRSITSSLSFGVEMQSQVRGTTQYVTVWVRRNGPELARGTVRLAAPAPFAIDGPAEHSVAFGEGNPLCRTTFRLRLPEDAVAGEGQLEAEYRDEAGATVGGRFTVGAQYDWLCTGPVGPTDARLGGLMARTTVTDADLDAGWAPYPAAGYDAYRRLNFETAYGQLRNVWLFLVTDVFVEKEGSYLALLTADDVAWVFVDGQPAIEQDAGGPGEGRMVTRRVVLGRGRHRLFVRHFQADFDDPVGDDAERHTYNHCVLKLLVRADRHEPATTVRGLPAHRR